jgi:hypothetical protein
VKMKSNHMFLPYFFQNIIIIGLYMTLFFLKFLISTLICIFLFNIFKIWIEEHYSIHDWHTVKLCPKFWRDLWYIWLWNYKMLQLNNSSNLKYLLKMNTITPHTTSYMGVRKSEHRECWFWIVLCRGKLS